MPLLAGLAARLAEAERTRVPVAPLTDDHGHLSAADAYAIQQENIRRRIDGGARLVGHKIGLTARSMQERFGVDEPDYGTLLDDMLVPEGATLPYARFIQPMVEIETAFVIGRPLRGPGLTIVDVIRAVEYVLPAIEIIDSRVEEWRIRLADTIADNGSSAAFVVGGRPLPLTAVDLRTMKCALTVNGEPVANALASAVLGNPLAAVAWLANAIGRYAGVALEEGHVVLPGTPVLAHPVGPGPAHVVAGFDGLGTVEVSFAK